MNHFFTFFFFFFTVLLPKDCSLDTIIWSCSFKNPCYFFYGFILFLLQFWASLIAQLVKNPPAMQETPVRFVGWEDPLEKGKATHSSILGLLLWLSWQRICLQCRRPGFSPGVGKIPWRRERLPTPVFWPGEFHGLYSPWGRKQTQLSNFHFLSFEEPELVDTENGDIQIQYFICYLVI